MLRAVQYPVVALLPGRVVRIAASGTLLGQPAIRGAARFGQRMGPSGIADRRAASGRSRRASRARPVSRRRIATFQFCTSLSARPLSPRATSSAIRAKVRTSVSGSEDRSRHSPRGCRACGCRWPRHLRGIDGGRRGRRGEHVPFLSPVPADEGRDDIVDQAGQAASRIMRWVLRSGDRRSA